MTVLSVLTIGHSNHSIEKFIGLLHQHDVEVLVDARSQPFSRFSPHFSRKPLERAVTDASMVYMFMGDALGGRPKAQELYDANGKVLYDKVEEQEFYRAGIARLVDTIRQRRVCVLCCEEDPSQCHRRLLVTRTLLHSGVEVLHVRGTGQLEPEADVQARAEGSARSTRDTRQMRLGLP